MTQHIVKISGGHQCNLLEAAFAEDEALSCSSQYGLCE